MSITLERGDRSHVATLTLDVDELNRLTLDRIERLHEVAASVPEEVAVLVVSPAGPGLSAGLDIREAVDYDVTAAHEMFDALYGTVEAVRSVDAVTVCSCRDYALGAGLELAMSCDFRLATAEATLGLPEIEIGLPTVIHGCLLSDLVGVGLAKELIYTGETISGAEASQIGLVHDAPVDAEYDAALADRVDTLAAKSPAVLRAQKRVFDDLRVYGLEGGMRASKTVGARSFSLRDRSEAMQAFLEGRDPVFEGR